MKIHSPLRRTRSLSRSPSLQISLLLPLMSTPPRPLLLKLFLTQRFATNKLEIQLDQETKDKLVEKLNKSKKKDVP